MTVTLYGLKNCDTCRKAWRLLDAAGVGHGFVDLRDTPVDAARLAQWLETVGWQTLVNKRSRSWRALDAYQRETLDAHSTLELLGQHPTLIKRPVLELPNDLIVGFNPSRYAAAIEQLGQQR